MAAKAN